MMERSTEYYWNAAFFSKFESVRNFCRKCIDQAVLMAVFVIESEARVLVT